MDKKFLENSFLFAGNALFVEEMYEKFVTDNNSVSSEWQSYFRSFQESNIPHPTWVAKKNSVIGVSAAEESDKKAKPAALPKSAEASFSTFFLVEKFRKDGHYLAILDPLGMEKPFFTEEFSLSELGVSEPDLDKKIISPITKKEITVKQLLIELKQIYCGNVGYEFSQVRSKEERDWLHEKAENLALQDIPANKKKEILTDLIEVESFEQFLHSRFPGAKRFSIEGGDVTITALSEVINTAAQHSDLKEVVIGMAHRGRLNVLTKVVKKSYVSLLSEFQGNLGHEESLNISGDVKYHLGKSTDINAEGGKKIHISLTANPSHLEAVNPVVLGKVRAKQDVLGDKNRTMVMGITLHGDAAFSGQGVVAESLCLSELEAYNIGGTIHIITNNQIGFTANPTSGRSGRYPTEFAKIIGAPVIHVNADYPEDVAKAAKMAEEFRQKFKKDIVIDLCCYRRYGHNEGDEPMFTQPKMYKIIKDKKTVAALFGEKLASSSIFTKEEYKKYEEDFYKKLDGYYLESKTYKPAKSEWLEGLWSGMYKYESGKNKSEKTGIDLAKLKEIGKALVTYPSSFNLNSKLQRLLEVKKTMFETGENIDWATGEALAYGSLLCEKKKVRITGQDSRRGTFSHRHAVFIDQENESTYMPLNNIIKDQQLLEVADSNLSEYAVLGFEYGYSNVDPNCLTIWEAQFGDFSNGAQIMIDQFISSAEQKWLRMSGLVMLLPHGYEGMGPEHSSARLERYLQLCADDNMQVVNITTPANFFHALRRQVTDRNYRKPLIVMSPKSLLRHKLAVSKISDMEAGTSFTKIIDETVKINPKEKISKVILTSGKIYYELLEEREKRGLKDIAIVRIEQYYPLPKEELVEIFKSYKNASFVWCQEEPKNMGAWSFLFPHLQDLLKNKELAYVGREESASPAAGYLKTHVKEQEKIINDALIKD